MIDTVGYCKKEVVIGLIWQKCQSLLKHKLNKDRTDYTQYPVIFYFFIARTQYQLLYYLQNTYNELASLR